MGVALGRRQLPSSEALLRAEAERFLKAQGTRGARVYRVEEINPSVRWALFVTAMGKARYIVLGGAVPREWEKISEGSGWPVV